MSEAIVQRSQSSCFGGTVAFYSHRSMVCDCEMRFSVYVPPQAKERAVPVLYFLSGLTCTEENFMVKAGAQRYAAEYGLILVAPDTSPRGLNLPGEDDDWEFGTGAGFYVDAIVEPWRSHYRMYSYVTAELPQLIAQHFPVQANRSGIFGHSMGGHGALVCALRNPLQYQSVSAFAPIVAPMQCPWGQKAFSLYLGDDRALWSQYDATKLVQTVQLDHPILIDQGIADQFLANQLMPQTFTTACEASGQEIILRMQAGYDHSYYFIATFVEDHIRHHAQALCQP
ncbi:S-formylglutathione hydrolase [Alkalinema sp. FACHB-956]|uniref:S-formylglutathione hydrolase n=1 Tax=Alkalinema sp. FACHB-956 TaxID=2692768 RepID=UPI0016865C96|nr:S-formylglutathione hydrolase [Alkalinema sp. FACHB-956]MBD2327212.1 S-formylglutathione hydrolase [Alkalinema sp. FACHB-956]